MYQWWQVEKSLSQNNIYNIIPILPLQNMHIYISLSKLPPDPVSALPECVWHLSTSLCPTTTPPSSLIQMAVSPDCSSRPCPHLFPAQSPPSDHPEMEKILSFPFWKPFPLYLGWVLGWAGRVYPAASGHITFPVVDALSYPALLPFPRLSTLAPVCVMPILPQRLVLMLWSHRAFLIPETETEPRVLSSLITL